MITKFISKSFATHKFMALRSQTFDIDKINKRLQQFLKTTTNQGTRLSIAEIFKISQIITELEQELQDQPIFQKLFYQLGRKGYNIYLQGLVMHVSKPIQYYNNIFKVHLHLKGQPFEIRNDPSVRQSLYFNELKDFDKHINVYRQDVNVPQKFKQLQKKQIEGMVIDQDNPLGYPQVDPQLINIQIRNQKTRQIDGKLYYYLGKIQLTQLSMSHDDNSSSKNKVMNLYKMNDKIGNSLKDFIQDLIPSQDIDQISTFSTILGQVSQIQQLKKLHRIFSQQIIGQSSDNF